MTVLALRLTPYVHWISHLLLLLLLLLLLSC
jgi:hypothetical protein